MSENPFWVIFRVVEIWLADRYGALKPDWSVLDTPLFSKFDFLKIFENLILINRFFEKNVLLTPGSCTYEPGSTFDPEVLSDHSLDQHLLSTTRFWYFPLKCSFDLWPGTNKRILCCLTLLQSREYCQILHIKQRKHLSSLSQYFFFKLNEVIIICASNYSYHLQY